MLNDELRDCEALDLRSLKRLNRVLGLGRRVPDNVMDLGMLWKFT